MTSSVVKFHINGEEHSVGPDQNVSGKTVMVDYIRDVALLKGTKVMCREGGCGACLVTAKVIDPNTGSHVVKSVNSCLTPVLSCDGWDISTIERLGNKQEGYHNIQNRLVNFHGTQCGYCSPGMVMSMYGLSEGKNELGIDDIDKTLDGNICRCTGYRPILEAFKSLTNDASDDLRRKCADIEGCAACPVRQNNGSCSSSKARSSSTCLINLKHSGEQWVTAKSVEAALKAASSDTDSVRFVAGNTSTGIFKNEGPYNKYIDINGVAKLKNIQIDNDQIVIGGGTTLTELINLLKEKSIDTGFQYGVRFVKHLERVANVSVRNNGTIAGNLMIKHNHRDFPSDIFVLLEAIGAKVTLASLKKTPPGCRTFPPITVQEFLTTDMNQKLILSIHLPKREGYQFRSFKITRRYQNAHAYVNAAFLFKVERNSEEKVIVVEKPRLVYGGISADFIHASTAEETLVGKDLSDANTLMEAFHALDNGMENISGGLLESAPKYRRQLVKSLLYKTILEIVGDQVNKRFLSGATDLTRMLTKTQQTFDKDVTDVALYKPVPKYEATIQVSGEAEYTGDIPVQAGELFGVFVTSDVALADIVNIDASEALKIPGVIRVITAKDVPGVNDSMKFNFMPSVIEEPVFATNKVHYYGQSLALLLATSRSVAESASKLVKVTYSNIKTPVVTIDEAITKAKHDGTYDKQTVGKFTTKPDESIQGKHTLEGCFRTGSQYHFYLETPAVVCYPREDGIDIHCTTQWHDHVQNNVAMALNIPTNAVNVTARRLGGGFGGKSSSPTMLSIAAAVATWVTNRPVRIVLDMEKSMSLFKKRHPYKIPYEVGFDDSGRIGSLTMDIICDSGYSANEATVFFALIHIQNVYKAVGWEVDTHWVTTNTTPNTFCRAPGSLQSIAAIEWIMDQIGNFLNLDPIQVRLANMLKTGDAMLYEPPIYEGHNLIPAMIEKMKAETNWDLRKKEVDIFNKENRWKKRGLGLVPVRFPIDYFEVAFPASIAIYHMDGHIAVSHGGIEMGQGLNTKIIQTVAQSLQVPMDRVKVKATNNFVAANAAGSGGSVSSELVCYSVARACEEIRENLRPILEKLENPTWEKLISEAYQAKVKLTASYTPTAKDDLKGYDVWVISATEVEIDVLTGEYKILRTDLYEDAGKSLNPAIDLGQIEGGYIFGQGFWTTEKIVFDETTGKLLTNGTWDYKPPECKDIPEDFRVTLWSDAPNPNGVLRSKATGEPSTDSAFAFVLAIRSAIASARKDAGNEDWFEMDYPVTPEEVALLSLSDAHEYTY